MSISKIKIIAVAVVVMTIVALCAAMVTGAAGFSQPGITHQDDDDVEDCDAEDWANREDDCGFTKPSPRKTTTVKATPKATAGLRVTRR